MQQVVYLTEEHLRNIIREALTELSETSACLGAPYYSVRWLCHDVKSGDMDAIDRAAILMHKYVPSNSVLIPIPQHTGKAEYTLKLAKRIAQLSKSVVMDVLRIKQRNTTLYLQKKRGADVSNLDLGVTAVYDESIAEKIKSARNVILIDNAIDSGLTYDQSRDAVKQTYGVDAWLLTLGAVVEPKDKSRDVIRSTYATYPIYETTTDIFDEYQPIDHL